MILCVMKGDITVPHRQGKDAVIAARGPGLNQKEADEDHGQGAPDPERIAFAENQHRPENAGPGHEVTDLRGKDRPAMADDPDIASIGQRVDCSRGDQRAIGTCQRQGGRDPAAGQKRLAPVRGQVQSARRLPEVRPGPARQCRACQALSLPARRRRRRRAPRARRRAPPGRAGSPRAERSSGCPQALQGCREGAEGSGRSSPNASASGRANIGTSAIKTATSPAGRPSCA